MGDSSVIAAEVRSVRGHRIRLTTRQWYHISTNHDYMETITIDQRLIPLLLQLPARQVWVEYDAEGDVLYVSFARPQQATDSVMGEDGNVYHYRGEQLVGVTILHACQRAHAPDE